MKNLNFKNLKSDFLCEKDQIFSDLNSKKQKKINSKYFYDELGSKLFDKISKLDDYYPTKKEIEILEKNKDNFQRLLPENASIIEFGSGSNIKIKKLLKAIKNPKEYIPIDISQEFLLFNAKKIAKEFPSMPVNAICADYHQMNSLKNFVNNKRKNIGFFPGSTIGNYCPDEAKLLMINFAKIIGYNNFLLVGVDLRKEKCLMEKAYNDSQGITAAFNKNILNGISKKIGLSFNQDDFEHKAYFNEEKKRIEMHLVCTRDINLNFINGSIKILKGETIHTENSYKYSINEFENLSKISGFETIDVLTDEKKYFSIFFLKVYSN
tara:strand:- start:363 stop:1331 length:969 start_codon:yes stop_codon:yes gene_type:complete